MPDIFLIMFESVMISPVRVLNWRLLHLVSSAGIRDVRRLTLLIHSYISPIFIKEARYTPSLKQP